MGWWGGVGWGGVVAHKILVSAQGPLVLVLGLRVWGQGLTIIDYKSFVKKVEFALDKTEFCLVFVKASCTCVVFIKRYSHNVTGPN